MKKTKVKLSAEVAEVLEDEIAAVESGGVCGYSTGLELAMCGWIDSRRTARRQGV